MIRFALLLQAASFGEKLSSQAFIDNPKPEGRQLPNGRRGLQHWPETTRAPQSVLSRACGNVMLQGQSCIRGKQDHSAV